MARKKDELKKTKKTTQDSRKAKVKTDKKKEPAKKKNKIVVKSASVGGKVPSRVAPASEGKTKKKTKKIIFKTPKEKSLSKRPGTPVQAPAAKTREKRPVSDTQKVFL
ncbi:MAG: hypothetical protein JW800_01370, partial [Candidatus Omnitrophica bacterium]|nr:hypothetical protein [Candidatus Omnitrophota bacterium]